MLEIKDLKKRYGRFQALDGLSMEVGPARPRSCARGT